MEAHVEFLYEQIEIIIQYMRNRVPLNQTPDLIIPGFQPTESVDFNDIIFDLDASRLVFNLRELLDFTQF